MEYTFSQINLSNRANMLVKKRRDINRTDSENIEISLLSVNSSQQPEWYIEKAQEHQLQALANHAPELSAE